MVEGQMDDGRGWMTKGEYGGVMVDGWMNAVGVIMEGWMDKQSHTL
jgi:hypothetical protein